MTSSNGNIFCVTGPLCGEFTSHQWIPRTKASEVELWCFLWSASWINSWTNDREADDLRRQRAHYDVLVMLDKNSYIFIQENVFQNVIWKMLAILSQPQCFKPNIAYKHQQAVMVIISLINGFCLFDAWRNVDVSSMGPWWTNVSEILIKIQNIFCKKIPFKSAVCKMLAILFRPQSVTPPLGPMDIDLGNSGLVTRHVF